ncbi:hypothetical protein PAF17_11905 [Paracoccus sp. Z330]|uniref:Uncharacterized protein n=1 Tax=Paracoccus onchidii TaxID=3017813 RepID=A0ABT4ZFP7_9RHOB|nr:hypothetical protein [Paracoccus onchidii]MDB6178199.1 hypothetical protein [Paracoccus onchidii]
MQDHDDDAPIHEYGWWPEIAGVLAVAAVVWFLFIFATGSI